MLREREVFKTRCQNLRMKEYHFALSAKFNLLKEYTLY